jgi:hypothetical protein
VGGISLLISQGDILRSQTPPIDLIQGLILAPSLAAAGEDSPFPRPSVVHPGLDSAGSGKLAYEVSEGGAQGKGREDGGRKWSHERGGGGERCCEHFGRGRGKRLVWAGTTVCRVRFAAAVDDSVWLVPAPAYSCSPPSSEDYDEDGE